MPSWKSEPSISSPETSTGTVLPDRLTQRPQISRFGASAFPTGSLALSGLQDSALTASHSLKGSLTSNILMNLQNKGILNNGHSSLATSSASFQSSLASPYASKTVSLGNSDVPGTAQSTAMWKPSTYTDRLSSSSVFSEGLASAFGSPKSKKTGVETKDELLSSILSRQEAATSSSSAKVMSSNVRSTCLHLCNCLIKVWKNWLYVTLLMKWLHVILLGGGAATIANLRFNWSTDGIFLLTSVCTAHAWWIFRVCSKVHPRGCEKSSHWTSSSVSHAGGKNFYHLVCRVVLVLLFLSSIFTFIELRALHSVHCGKYLYNLSQWRRISF